MHIYFIGIGGTGIGPLALIASQAGYEVSGSDSKESEYTHYLTKKGILLDLDQSGAYIEKRHTEKPIDWVVSVSSITRNTPNHPELAFARNHNIKITERDAALNEILTAKKLSMIAAAGTHGKTTTSAMFVWVMKQLGIPVSHSVGAKMSYADMGHYEPNSSYFVYECDEFHRNFLHFYPAVSVISGIAWDHHEVFPTQEDYNLAFKEFISQSGHTYMWNEDATKIGVTASSSITILDEQDPEIEKLEITGKFNRRNAWLVVNALQNITGSPKETIIEIINSFPGTQRRMEELAPNLFTDYAHTPEKIMGCLSVAEEIARKRNKRIVVVYEPLTNRRQHYMKELYRDTFLGVDRLYWTPSYLSREDPNLPVLTPTDLIRSLANPSVATASELDDSLWSAISEHMKDSIVVCMSGGGGGSLDEWLRSKVQEPNR